MRILRLSTWIFTVFSKAMKGNECFNKAALIKTLLSKTILIYSSFSKSSNFSFVTPCLDAYSPSSSITCKTGFGPETHRSIICDSSIFLSSCSRSIFSAVSFFTCMLIAFIFKFFSLFTKARKHRHIFRCTIRKRSIGKVNDPWLTEILTILNQGFVKRAFTVHCKLQPISHITL